MKEEVGEVWSLSSGLSARLDTQMLLRDLLPEKTFHSVNTEYCSAYT
jgi:hypothetical protein